MTRILIINHCSTNKGDRAVLEYVVQRIQAIAEVDCKITILSNDPETEFGTESIKMLPWPWDVRYTNSGDFFSRLKNRVRRVFFQLRYEAVKYLVLCGYSGGLPRWTASRSVRDAFSAADVVLGTGGHHFTTFLERNVKCPQSYELALAKMSGKKTILWSQSIGPFEFTDNINRIYVQKLLSYPATLCIRDEASFRFMSMSRLTLNNIVKTEESVFGLCADLDESCQNIRESNRIVGISVYNVKFRSPEHQAFYANLLVEITKYLIFKNYTVRYFPMQYENKASDDRRLIRSIRERVGPGSLEIMGDFSSMASHKAAIGKCDFFVGHKTHSIIMALSEATPIVAYAYHEKTKDFMEKFDMKEFCIDDRDLKLNSFTEKFERLEKNEFEVRAKLKAISAKIASSTNVCFQKYVADEIVKEASRYQSSATRFQTHNSK